jgi:hypothetical protein
MHFILFLQSDYKLRSPDAVDSLLSSEIPDPEVDPVLHEMVMKYMIHTPCGSANDNPNALCINNECCSKSFLKQFQEQTSINKDTYSNTCRCDTGRTFKTASGKNVDNCWVVCYCPYLLKKYDCYINVECILSIKAIKYIYKYVYKSHDYIILGVQTGQEDKCQLYLNV